MLRWQRYSPRWPPPCDIFGNPKIVRRARTTPALRPVALIWWPEGHWPLPYSGNHLSRVYGLRRKVSGDVGCRWNPNASPDARGAPLDPLADQVSPAALRHTESGASPSCDANRALPSPATGARARPCVFSPVRAKEMPRVAAQGCSGRTECATRRLRDFEANPIHRPPSMMRFVKRCPAGAGQGETWGRRRCASRVARRDGIPRLSRTSIC